MQRLMAQLGEQFAESARLKAEIEKSFWRWDHAFPS
jgi:hypothetical protein